MVGHAAEVDGDNWPGLEEGAGGGIEVRLIERRPLALWQRADRFALVDTDGKPGGLGNASTHGCDDCFAGFSNYGSEIAFVAPGRRTLPLTRPLVT